MRKATSLFGRGMVMRLGSQHPISKAAASVLVISVEAIHHSCTARCKSALYNFPMQNDFRCKIKEIAMRTSSLVAKMKHKVWIRKGRGNWLASIFPVISRNQRDILAKAESK